MEGLRDGTQTGLSEDNHEVLPCLSLQYAEIIGTHQHTQLPMRLLFIYYSFIHPVVVLEDTFVCLRRGPTQSRLTLDRQGQA